MTLDPELATCPRRLGLPKLVDASELRAPLQISAMFYGVVRLCTVDLLVEVWLG